MTARRVASAHKTEPTIAAALTGTPEFVERAEALAERINLLHPTVQEQQTTESVLWIAVAAGLDELEARYAKETTP